MFRMIPLHLKGSRFICGRCDPTQRFLFTWVSFDLTSGRCLCTLGSTTNLVNPSPLKFESSSQDSAHHHSAD